MIKTASLVNCVGAAPRWTPLLHTRLGSSLHRYSARARSLSQPVSVRQAFSRGSCRLLASQAVQEAQSSSAVQEMTVPAADLHAQQAWEFWRRLGSPRYHVAPMVDQVSDCSLLLIASNACVRADCS